MIKQGVTDWKEEKLPERLHKELQVSEALLRKRESPFINSSENSETTNEKPKNGELSFSETLDRLFKKTRSILTHERQKDRNASIIEMLDRVEELSVGEEDYENLSDETLLRRSEKKFVPVLGAAGAIDRDLLYKIIERPGINFKRKSENKF